MKKIIFFILTTLAVNYGFGQWVSGGTQISFSSAENHRPFVSPAPGNGYYITWQSTDTDSAGLSAIHLSAYDANGNLLSGWTSGGITISVAGGDFFAPQIVTSEDGDVIASWYGYLPGSNKSQIYAQKYSYSGVPLWNAGNPVQVSTGAYVCEYPMIVSDKNKGAFMSWNRFDTLIDFSSEDVMLQHIDSAGNVAAGWNASGTDVATTAGVPEYYSQLAFTPDESGVYVTYASGFIGATSLEMIRFNAADGSLASGWSGAITISSGPNVYPQINHDLKLYCDAANNAVVFWVEAKLTANGEIYIQQVSPAATQLLTNGGVFLAGDIGGDAEGIDYLEVEQDADMNFLVAFNNLVTFDDISAMRVKPDGTIIWINDPITNDGNSEYPLAVPDGSRGMFLFYSKINTHDLYGIEYDSTGAMTSSFTLPGSNFGIINDYDGFDPNYDFNAMAAGNGKAIVAWNRKATASLYQIFTCNLLSDGSICSQSQTALTVDLGPDQTVCSGSFTLLNATISGGQAPYGYQWAVSGSSAFISCGQCQNPYATPTANCIYIVTVTDNNNQTAADTVNFFVNPLPAVAMGVPLLDTVCIDMQNLDLGGTPTGGIYSGNGVDTNGIFHPAVAGVGISSIRYIYTDSLGCRDTAYALITVTICEGVSDIENDLSVKLSPNPCNGYALAVVNAKMGFGGLVLKLFDLSGKVLVEQKINSNINKIATSQLAAGMYLYGVYNGSNILQKGKLIKQ